MALVKLVLPKTLIDLNEVADIVFFLAGPIKGAGDWQKEVIKVLQKHVDRLDCRGSVYVICPSEYQSTHELYPLRVTGIPDGSYTEEQKMITRSRTDWERHYLEVASRLGCIVFWLGQEDKNNPRKKEDGPYARDTYGELGEWRARIFYEREHNNTQINLVLGAHPDFPGLTQIERNFKRMVDEDFQISSSIDGTIKRALEKEGVLRACRR